MEINGAQPFFLVFISFSFHTVLLSFGQTFWIQSVQFEVFTLNNLFICIVLYLTVKFYYYYWREENQHRNRVSNSIPNSVPNCMLRSFYLCSVPLQSAHDCFLPVPNHCFHSLHLTQNSWTEFQTFFPTHIPVFGRTLALCLLSHRFVLSKESQLGRCTHIIW